jgi:hypothetical protein
MIFASTFDYPGRLGDPALHLKGNFSKGTSTIGYSDKLRRTVYLKRTLSSSEESLTRLSPSQIIRMAAYGLSEL